MRQPSQHLSNRFPVPFVAFAVLAILSFLLSACGEAPQAEAKPPRPVLTTEVRFQAQSADRSFVGTIRPRVEADVGFRVAGKVAKRFVEVGNIVEVGQPLAALDETDLNLQAEQAESELRAAKGVLAQAQATEGRTKELRAKGWSTEAQMDQVRAAADEARSRVYRAERSVELTRNSRSYATLLADARGVVTSTSAEPGQVVAAGQGVIRIARDAEKETVVAIPETLVGRAQNGDAKVSLWSEPGKTYTARLRELAPSADPATRTYLAKFSMPDATDAVKLGMTATLTLTDRQGERSARLPLSSILNQGQGPSVFVVDAATGSIALKPVKVTAYETREVVISGGVNEGDQVVTLGVHKLDPEQKVRVVSNLSF